MILFRLRSEQISCVYPWVGSPHHIQLIYPKSTKVDARRCEKIQVYILQVFLRDFVYIGNGFFACFLICVVVLFSIHAVFYDVVFLGHLNVVSQMIEFITQ